MPKSTIPFVHCAQNFPDGTIELRNYGQFNTEMHTHEQVQVLSPTNGTLFIYTEKASFCVPSTFYVYIPAHVPHKLISRSQQLSLKTIFVDMNNMHEEVKVYPSNELLNHFLIFGQRHWKLKDHDTMTRSTLEAFKSMLPILLAKPILLQITPAKSELMIQVSTYILQHLDNKLSIAEISANFFLSERTLFRQFKEEMQITIFQFIKQHRLLRALQLLENKDMHIAEIVYQVGYESVPNFSNLFKEYFGLSPQQYRARL